MHIKKLLEILPENVDAALITSAENRFYFTGFKSSAGFLLATRNGSVFMTDSRYIEQAYNQINCCDVKEFVSQSKALAEAIALFQCKTIAIEAQRTTVQEFKKITDICNGIAIDDSTVLDDCVNALRGIKSCDEVNTIRQAQAIAERAFENILNFIQVGVTEREIALELDFFMLKNGAHGLSFDTIAVSGKNSSKPHGVPSDKKIQNGDFITMDFGAVYNGYHSDMTRTVAVGSVSDEQSKIYETVLKAQQASLSILKAGVSCREADSAARDIIAAAGYAENYRHGTGHGVGIEIHEGPTLSPKSEHVLQSGQVVTVEPGIYLPEKFGIRIEDMALITQDGYENLTSAPKHLIIL